MNKSRFLEALWGKVGRANNEGRMSDDKLAMFDAEQFEALEKAGWNMHPFDSDNEKKIE